MPRVSPAPLVIGAITGAILLRGHRHSKEAERLTAAALETLLNAIDANDAMTGAHVRRVAQYALALADAARCNEAMKRSIERVALFHDIGKIHAALFDVIHENTKLTASERRLIKLHPQRGADVLEPIAAFYPDLRDGVLAHHERWDGSGYPAKLEGLNIPLAARVVAIADTFDAITHRRRYRGAASAKRAFTAIREGSGTQFDPDLVALWETPKLRKTITQLLRAAHRPARKKDRRRVRAEEDAPDVTFRWRTAANAPRSRDRER